MKKLILLSSIIIILISCSDNSLNYDKCLEEVKTEFPKGKIYNAIGFREYEFVVIDSNNLYLVETMSYNHGKIRDIHLLKIN